MSSFRGWFGEKKAAFKLWLWLDKKDYQRFDNLIIPGNNGTSQLDHLLISTYGIFIIETKNRTGWIFGSEKQQKWTQTLHGTKYSFQNPLKQTYRQKKVLSEFLGIKESTIHTIVYFVGDCKFKTQLPPNVMKSGLTRYIKRFKKKILLPDETNQLIKIITQHKSESSITRKAHIRSLRKRHASTTICPNCGDNLIEKTAKKGFNAGSKFLGCSNYPRCRFTKNL
jgi:restriction system protein